MLIKTVSWGGVKYDLHAENGYNILRWQEPFGATKMRKTRRLTVAESTAFEKSPISWLQKNAVIVDSGDRLTALKDEADRRARLDMRTQNIAGHLTTGGLKPTDNQNTAQETNRRAQAGTVAAREAAIAGARTRGILAQPTVVANVKQPATSKKSATASSLTKPITAAEAKAKIDGARKIAANILKKAA